MLLPNNEISSFRIPRRPDLSGIQAKIQGFAYERNLSSTMVAYRLFRHGSISELQWQQLRRRLRDFWKQGVSSRRARNREATGGPNYYVVRRHRVGGYLVEFVARMLHNGAVTTTRARSLLASLCPSAILQDPAPSGAGSQLAGSPVRREDPGREGPLVIRTAS